MICFISFGIGLFVGTIVGMFGFSLCSMISKGNNVYEHFSYPEQGRLKQFIKYNKGKDDGI